MGINHYDTGTFNRMNFIVYEKSHCGETFTNNSIVVLVCSNAFRRIKFHSASHVPSARRTFHFEEFSWPILKRNFFSMEVTFKYDYESDIT